LFVVFTCDSGFIHHDITDKINESGLKDPYITFGSPVLGDPNTGVVYQYC